MGLENGAEHRDDVVPQAPCDRPGGYLLRLVRNVVEGGDNKLAAGGVHQGLEHLGPPARRV